MGKFSLQCTCKAKEGPHGDRFFSGSMVTRAIAAATVGAAVWIPITETLGSAPAVLRHGAENTVGRTRSTGKLDDTYDTPFQCAHPNMPRKEFFTESQREELDRRANLLSNGRGETRGVATEFDVARAYNHAVFLSNITSGAHVAWLSSPMSLIPRLDAGCAEEAAGDRDSVSPGCKRPRTCKAKSAPCMLVGI